MVAAHGACAPASLGSVGLRRQWERGGRKGIEKNQFFLFFKDREQILRDRENLCRDRDLLECTCST